MKFKLSLSGHWLNSLIKDILFVSRLLWFRKLLKNIYQILFLFNWLLICN